MWIPLHLHSQYSILDAACPVKGIAKKAKAAGMEACALTDHGNMHGAVDFYKACISEGVKPILGCEVYVAPGSRLEKKRAAPGIRNAYHLVLLAKNDEGYHNLCKLTSIGYLEGFYYFPRIDKELLKQHSGGLICLSACLSSQVAAAALKGEEALEEEINWHHDLFGEDYYLELQRHKMDQPTFDESWLQHDYEDFIQKQERVNEQLIAMSKKKGIPLVATNDTHYLEPEDWQAHEILLNIQTGEPVEIWERDSQGNPTMRVPNPKRRVYASRELYFKTSEQMAKIFADVPEAISNTVEVAKKCEVELDFKTKHYPVYVPPDLRDKECADEERAKASADFLLKLCEEGIEKRYNEERLEKAGGLEAVKSRLEHEFGLISRMGMCDYLLIVWDFINWAKSQGIPVGPGRGSGAGSIVLYLIGITDIEPLRFGLFFERFINPERISYPDIDVDICMWGRSDVIDYTVRTYGSDNVAQIITFGTMKAKMAIKDVGRVLSVPLAKVNQIAKFVPDDLGMTIDRALEIDVDLYNIYDKDPDAKRVIDLARRLEGSIRNTGIHAAGLIVCGQPLTDHIPVCLAKDSQLAATQYSMKPVEAVGMLKIDFLGLKTLTSIKICCEAIEKKTGKKIDPVNLPLEDPKTFQLLKEGRTLGVFQMESGGMQELAKQLGPDRFEEIMAIGALYRPGPMDMIPSFIARKHGKEPIDSDHPLMEPILAETYGIMVYQEQVMQIAQKLAGYSLGEGDVLRKAMGKKDADQMAKEREKFRTGCIDNGIEESVATAIFDKMEKFAAYGFNKSHAAAYGFITYVTAYLKANYPSEWMAALMTCDRDDISKVAKFIREGKSMQIEILPPDVNEAGKEFVATKSGIRFAMSGIKGVGEGVVEAIIEEREKGGPFKNFYNFFERIDLKRVGKKPIECLVDAGSFDFTGWSRDAMRQSVEQMYDVAAKEQKEKASGVMTLFNLIGEGTEKRFEKEPKVATATPKGQILIKEKELLGFFLTGHPMENYAKVLQRLSCIPLGRVEELEHNAIFRAAFIVDSVQVRISQKKQQKFAILRIGDGMVSYELPVWPDLYEQKSDLLDENRLLYAVLQVDRREESLRIQCRWLDDLTQVNEQMMEACDQAFDAAKLRVQRSEMMQKKKVEQEVAKAVETVTLKMDATKARLSYILKIKKLLKAHEGKQPVKLAFYVGENREATLDLNGLQVDFSKKLESALKPLGVERG
ncbi:MAG: DNA polymerase III subunit alpha [Chlamydiales bacterium]|nr:DNA polymerase III subunit alpha [Chlamydiales bacterium]MCH9636012.1 DNA polymerase III subunit alpha [Chlamydiales bacterium]MCH9703887.1 DNA polymerase III subunit alpha [Chlamydiota bacterium]